MSQIKFKYNIGKDAWSWVLIAKDKNLWGLDWNDEVGHIPKNLLSQVLKASFADAEEIVREHLQGDRKRKYKCLIIKEEMRSLEIAWKMVEQQYWQALEKMTGKPIFSEEFNCFWTTGYMCPYNEKEKWFMVSLWRSLPDSITTICHEVMHLQFLHFYRNYLKKNGLNMKQSDNLKEALTILLNEPEFDAVVLSEDMGYPKHQELRNKLRQAWRKNRNWQKLLDEAIVMMKSDKGYS